MHGELDGKKKKEYSCVHGKVHGIYKKWSYKYVREYIYNMKEVEKHNKKIDFVLTNSQHI